MFLQACGACPDFEGFEPGFEPEVYNEKLKKTHVYTDLGLAITGSLKWNNHLETRLSKAHLVYRMVRRDSASNTSTQSKVCKAMIIESLLYGSECWLPNKSEQKKLKSFNSRVTRWIISRDDYKQKLSLSILPISYFIGLQELMMLSNLIDGRYDLDMQKFDHLKQSKKKRNSTCTSKSNQRNIAIKLLVLLVFSTL